MDARFRISLLLLLEEADVDKNSVQHIGRRKMQRWDDDNSQLAGSSPHAHTDDWFGKR